MKKLYLILLSAIEIFALNCTELKDLKQYNNHYYAITKNTFTFDEAKKYAEDNKGYLAIPNDTNENTYLKSLTGGGSGAWIGIYDSSYSTNYCYSLGDCTRTSNYMDIRNNTLSYTNWAINEPNNYVHAYDVSDGKQLVSPLGEHWVILSGNDGKWNDFGNHVNSNNNPARYRALIEFDTKPDCYDAPTNVVDTFTNAKCNTQVYDNTTNVLQTGTTFDCRTDVYNNTYCPAALSQCAQQFDYDSGYSISGVGQVIDYTNKIQNADYTTPAIVDDVTWFQSAVWLACSTGNEMFYNAFENAVRNMGGTSYCERGSVLWTNSGMSEFGETYWDPIEGTSQSSGFCKFSGGNGNLYLEGQSSPLPRDSKIYMSGGCDRATVNGMSFSRGIYITFGSQSTCTKILREYTSEGIPVYSCQSNNITCPSGYNKVSRNGYSLCEKLTAACPNNYSDIGNNQCKQTQEYTYYTYLCNNSVNTQGYNYTPTNSGGNTGKTDPNTTTTNDLTSPLNSSTPPANNCKREKFTCQANSNRPCSFVDNSWQCSPFPCIGGNDVTPLGTIEGSNDKKNDGWKESGDCAGQIYIFNGSDKRCRNWDMFFGLTGGGCCDKEKVFAGIVSCKDNEKALAKLNKAEQCHFIGEYCSKKAKMGIVEVCVQKSNSNCCFGSKLARAIHEQGRPQINMTWGSAESPQCRGFKPEEFQKLDFSKIDLSGTFDIPNLDQTKLNTTINNTITNFKNMLGN